MQDKIVRLKTSIADQSTVHRVNSNTTSPPLQGWKQTRVSNITHRQKTAKITGIHNGATMLQANCGRKQSKVKHSQEQDPFETRQWESWIKNRIETENMSLWSETNGGDYRASTTGDTRLSAARSADRSRSSLNGSDVAEPTGDNGCVLLGDAGGSDETWARFLRNWPESVVTR